jgi:4-diphosphocytidyl-2-C-methyl-D-erythritol kinase
MTTQDRIRLHACAKINLGLLVLGKRPDQYHDIETVFVEIAWHDVVELISGGGISMECTSPALPTDSSNLCIKAASLLRQWTSHDLGVHIRLVKNIPIGSGLGGGSSDAAAVLVGLNTLWDLQLDVAELTRLAATLGSDVPFFIQGGAAIATGRGEVLRHRDVTLPYWTLVVVPPLHISTVWAYGGVTPAPAGPDRTLHRVFESLPNLTREAFPLLINDFEPGVFAAYPAIRHVKQELLRTGAVHSLMSGSGSSVVGLFDTEPAAQQAARSFPVDHHTFLTPPGFHRDRTHAGGSAS